MGLLNSIKKQQTQKSKQQKQRFKVAPVAVPSKVQLSSAFRQLPPDGMVDKIRILLSNYLPFVNCDNPRDQMILEQVQTSILWSVYNNQVGGQRIIKAIASACMTPEQRVMGLTTSNVSTASITATALASRMSASIESDVHNVDSMQLAAAVSCDCLCRLGQNSTLVSVVEDSIFKAIYPNWNKFSKSVMGKNRDSRNNFAFYTEGTYFQQSKAHTDLISKQKELLSIAERKVASMQSEDYILQHFKGLSAHKQQEMVSQVMNAFLGAGEGGQVGGGAAAVEPSWDQLGRQDRERLFCSLSEQEQRSFLDLSDRLKGTFQKMTPDQRAAFMALPESERVECESMGQAALNRLVAMPPAQQRLALSLAGEDRQAFISMTDEQRAALQSMDVEQREAALLRFMKEPRRTAGNGSAGTSTSGGSEQHNKMVKMLLEQIPASWLSEIIPTLMAKKKQHQQQTHQHQQMPESCEGVAVDLGLGVSDFMDQQGKRLVCERLAKSLGLQVVDPVDLGLIPPPPDTHTLAADTGASSNSSSSRGGSSGSGGGSGSSSDPARASKAGRKPGGVTWRGLANSATAASATGARPASLAAVAKDALNVKALLQKRIKVLPTVRLRHCPPCATAFAFFGLEHEKILPNGIQRRSHARIILLFFCVAQRCLPGRGRKSFEGAD
jgi:hypothetical protein